MSDLDCRLAGVPETSQTLQCILNLQSVLRKNIVARSRDGYDMRQNVTVNATSGTIPLRLAPPVGIENNRHCSFEKKRLCTVTGIHGRLSVRFQGARYGNGGSWYSYGNSVSP